MYHPPTASEVRRLQQEHGIGLFAARRRLIRKRLSSAITDATTVTDLKDVLRVIINETWIDDL